MLIRVDTREQSRIKSAERYYKEDEVIVEELLTGDYVFDDKVVFEFKTMQDFISSINDGRVFNECIEQSEVYPHHFCIIQGSNYDLKRALEYSPATTMSHYYGAIARLNTYTTVVNIYGGVRNALNFMRVQASKCLDDTGKLKHYPVKSYNTAFNVLCHDIRGVNKVRAENIVSTCDCETVADVFKLTVDDLVNVDGIGEKIAENIVLQIGEL